MDTKLVARYAIRETMGIVVMGVALFWSAGQINWWPAWASIVVMLAWITATAIVIFRFNTRKTLTIARETRALLGALP